MFYTLLFHVFGKVLVKGRGRFGVFKYNTFCLLTHILQQYFHKKRINADILLDSNAYTLKTGSCSVYFHFSEIVFLWPPFHKWYHKQTKIKFHITKFNLSDRIYHIKCIYIRIEDILWPRKILRAVKVRAIWWGKAPCSLVHRVSLNIHI